MTSLTGAPASLGSMELKDNPSLSSLAGATLPSSSFYVINNDALTTLNGITVPPAAVLYHLRIEENGPLASLSGLNNLGTVHQTFSILNNATLPQCAAQAFSGRVAGGATRNISGNNTSATCP